MSERIETDGGRIVLYQGDALAVLPTLASGSVDAVVTDPPAGISFMGKEWDGDRGGRGRWIEWLASILTECRRVAKPGAFMLCWALPRTSHWTALAIEEAGWTIRDRVTHLFGQGFPKSQSCLKPGAEDWWLAKAPGPLASLQIDACRIPAPDGLASGGKVFPTRGNVYAQDEWTRENMLERSEPHPAGRWPANVTLDEEAARLLDEQSGTLTSGKQIAGGHVRSSPKHSGVYQPMVGTRCEGDVLYGDSGGASRFFYVAKASRAERGEGNDHPTVKSLALMRWLARLITPPGGTVLDPLMGSGSTVLACEQERFGCVGVEQDPHYFSVACQRLEKVVSDGPLFAQRALPEVAV